MAVRTLPFSITRLQAQYAVQFAGMTLVVMPPLFIVFLGSKWVMGGVTAGAVKG